MGDPVRKPFSWAAWLGGFFIALITGLIANLVFGFFAIDLSNPTLGILIELIPGTLFVVLSIRRWREAFEQGFLTGAAIVLLIGGICGATIINGMR